MTIPSDLKEAETALAGPARPGPLRIALSTILLGLVLLSIRNRPRA
jgi:hypothetical protein